MKAKVKETYSGITLSIGMIVKNEEEHLEACLKAMEPVRKAVSSELIIVDTGSTDRTVEIAGQYADQLLHFEWCNDFSAARNVSLKAASGKWFLYLDADEILDEDCSELIAFLKEPENKYQTAGLSLRNYTNLKHETFSSFMIMRLWRRIPQLTFVGSIHECPDPYLPPTKNLKTIVHHDGYIEDLTLKKKERNRDLILQELEKDPENLRTLRHLMDTFNTADPSGMAEFMSVGREMIALCEKKGCVGNVYWIFAFHSLIHALSVGKRYPEARRLINEYFEKKPAQDLVIDLDMYYMKGFLYINDEPNPTAREAFLHYQRLYRLIKKGELETDDVFTITVLHLHSEDYTTSCYTLARCWREANCLSKAREALEEAGPWTNSMLKQSGVFLNEEYSYAKAAEDYSRFTGLWEQMHSSLDSDGWKIWALFFEKTFSLYDAQKHAACLALAQVQADNPFAMLCRLRVAEGREQAEPLLEGLLADPQVRRMPAFADILYVALRHDMDLLPVLEAIDNSRIDRFLKVLLGQHPDWPQLLDDWLLAHPTAEDVPPLRLFLQTRLMLSLLVSQQTKKEKEALSEEPQDENLPLGVLKLEPATGEQQVEESPQNTLTDERFAALADRYLAAMERYLHAVYRPIMCEPENRRLLPAEHRFSLDWREAEALRRQQGDAAYLKRLEELLEDYPAMRRVIELPIERIRRELETQQRQEEEFERLGGMVKQKFYLLVSGGQKEAARQILDTYRGLCPNDPELIMMEGALSCTDGGKGIS